MKLADKYVKQPPKLSRAMHPDRQCAVVGCSPSPTESIFAPEDNCGFALCATHSLGFQKWILETNPIRMAEWIRKQATKPAPAPVAESERVGT